MAEQVEETLEDYLARLNIEGGRRAWYRNRKTIDFVLRKTSRYLKNVRTVCDIGLGDGHLLRRLNRMGLEVTGIDISRYLIEHLRKSFEKESLEVTLICADITSYRFNKNSFDAVTCLAMLEHLPGDGIKAAIENLKGCIVNGGLLIGTLPVGENLADNMVICPKCRHVFHRIGHCHSFDNLRQIRELLGPDFQIIKIGHTPLTLFKLNILNSLAYWLREFLHKVTGMKKAKLVYFVAKLNKSQSAKD